MNRRAFLQFPTPPITSSIETTAPLNGDLSPYTGEWNRAAATHLLRRILFGATIKDIDYFNTLDLETALEELLKESLRPLPPVNDYNDEEYTDPDVPFGSGWLQAPYNNEAEGARIWSLKCWWLSNMIEQEETIHEKMILFWFNHIPIQFYEVFFGRWDYRYIELMRRHALGNVKTLVKAVTLDAAMLHFLNGQYNHKEAPDENYARELQELYCIGKGPNANFTEGDVRAAARILTGWRHNYGNGQSYFEEEAHDNSDKQFSEFYGDRIIRGRSGQRGKEELDELLDMLFEQEECALFLCRKLYRFFVHYNIDEWTESNIIAPLAEQLRTNDYEILPVLKVLFGSQHFFDVLRKGAIIKSPIDFIVSLYREFNTPLPPKTRLRDRYEHNGNLVYMSYVFDQNLGDPPNVAGWPAYYQIPMFDKNWITTNTLPNRASFVDWILWSGISTENFLAQLDILATVEQIPGAADPNELVDFVVKWQFPIEVSTSFRSQLKAILLSGQVNDYYWTDAWNEYLFNPNDEMKREIVRSRLRPFFYTVLHQEEYQLF